MENKKPKNIKVVVYIPEGDHKRLRSRLALLGMNLSEWVREKIKLFLNS